MLNVGANRLQKKHDALNKKIQNPNLNSYQKMQMQQKAANKVMGGNIRNRFTFGANRQLKANLSNNLRTQRMREAIIYESITSNLIYALKKELLQKIRRKFMYPYEYAKLQLETVEVNHLLKKYVEYEEKIKEELEKTNGSKYSEMNIRNEYANKFMGSFKIFIKNRRFFGKKQFTDQAEYVKHCLAGRLRTGRPLNINDNLAYYYN